VFGRRRWTLEELKAEWLEAPEGRWGVGMRWICGKHARNNPQHWLTVYFINPADTEGALPRNGAKAAYREGGALVDLALTHPSGREWLDFGKCGRLRVHEGHVELVR
jgi:hypothetical protein